MGDSVGSGCGGGGGDDWRDVDGWGSDEDADAADSGSVTSGITEKKNLKS